MFDLDTLAASPTGVLHLRHPNTDEPIVADGNPVTITLYGPGSAEHVAAKAKQSNRYLERMNKKGGKPAALTAAELADSQADLLADCTVSIDNLATKKHAGLAGRALFRAIYADPAFGWIAQQANEFVGDWAHFTPSSTAS